MPTRLLSWILLTLVLLAAALWLWRDHPQLRAAAARLSLAVPMGSAPSPAAASAARKCVGAGRVVYTQEACPAGLREQALDGGTLSVLPAAPPRAAPATAAPALPASAVSPLRRLAGEGLPPDVQERRVDQALQR